MRKLLSFDSNSYYLENKLEEWYYEIDIFHLFKNMGTIWCYALYTYILFKVKEETNKEQNMDEVQKYSR